MFRLIQIDIEVWEYGKCNRPGANLVPRSQLWRSQREKPRHLSIDVGPRRSR